MEHPTINKEKIEPKAQDKTYNKKSDNTDNTSSDRVRRQAHTDATDNAEPGRRKFVTAGLAAASASVLLTAAPPAEATGSPYEFYNLLDAGIDLTGTTDVTTALQSILDQYPYIWIPAGAILRVSAPLNLTLPRQVIFGPGMAQVRGTGAYNDEPPKIVNNTTTTNVLYHSQLNAKITLKGFNVVANSSTATCIYFDSQNQDIVLENIAVCGTFATGFFIGGSENLQAKNLNSSGATMHDTMLDISGINCAHIDSIVTSNVVPHASTVTTSVRIYNGGSPYIGSVVLTNTTCQGTTIGLDLQMISSVVVNSIYCEQVVLPIRAGWVPSTVVSNNMGAVVSLIVNGGIFGGADSNHAQGSSHVVDIYIKHALNAILNACNHNGPANTAICFDNAASLRINSPYKNYGMIRDFVGHGLIAHSQTNSNSAASIICDMDFDSGSLALNSDGSLGTTPGMQMGSYRTIKLAAPSSDPSYGWRHYRQYIRDIVHKTPPEPNTPPTVVHELWVPPLLNLPALIL